MSTKVYGSSDDLVEMEGDVEAEVNHITKGEYDPGVLLACSDGTMLAVRYGKQERGIWEIKALRRGDLFIGIEECEDEDADVYSDVATFQDGLKWIYSATNFHRAR
jgi:hypothetical protein